MADINLSMPYLLVNEGGYSEPPMDDQPTKWGIIAADIAKHRGVPIESVTVDDIKNLQMPEATAIYKTQYWDVLSLDLVTSQNIATCIFDTGVNRGVTIGAKYAQKIANVYPDGIIGPQSIYAINKWGLPNFIGAYEQMVWAGYQEILAAKPQDEKYRHDWEGRARRLLILA